MSSFPENVISSKSRLLSAVDPMPQNPKSAASEYLKIYNSISEVNCAPPTGFPNTLPEPRSAVLQPPFHSDNSVMNDFDKQTYSTGGLPRLGAPHNVRDTSIGYAVDSFAQSNDNSFLSWKKCSSETNNRFHPSSHVAGPQMMGLQNEEFHYQMATVPNFYVSANSSINSNNLENSTGRILSDEVPASSWCPVSWPQHTLGTGGDGKAMEWTKSLPDPVAEVDSLFQRPELERSWRNRTSSDGGGITPHKNVSVISRSGQSASEGNSNPQPNHLLHRRRGRTASPSSTSSADSSTDIGAKDESRSINLPSGQSVNTADFDVTTCLPDAVARMSFVADQPNIHRPLPVSESSVLGQTLSAVDKSHLLVQTQSNFWPASQVPCSGVNSIVFDPKTEGYQRPGTSDQYTQHDTLGAFRNKIVDYSKVPGAFGYDGNGLDPGQQVVENGGAILSDDQLWYYEDPQGRIQGEFSSSQMLSWLLAGRYFTSSLRIRRKCDDTFSTLHSYVQLFGHVPFAGTTQIPPIRGGITPQLILMVRMHDQQNAANLPFACLDQQQLLHKLSRSMTGDGGCVIDTTFGFSKNGMSCPNVPTVTGQELLLKQLAETIASNPGAATMNINNHLFSLLSEWAAKTPLDPSLVQEMINSAGFNNPNVTTPWPSSPQSQFLLQQLNQQVPSQPIDDVFPASTAIVPDPGSGGFINNASQGVETAIPPSNENVPFRPASDLHSDNHSPKATRHKSAGGKSSSSGVSKPEPRPKQNANVPSIAKKSSQQQKHSPILSKSDGIGGNTGGQQIQRAISQSGCSSSVSSGCGGSTGGQWSNETPQFKSCSSGSGRLASAPERSQVTTTKSVKTCWTEKAGKVEMKQFSSSPTSSPLDGNVSKFMGPNSSATPPDKWNPQVPSSEGGNCVKKKAKSRQQQQLAVQNGVKKSGNNVAASSKKSKITPDDSSEMDEEFETLVRWVQSALVGIELKEKFDIPTFVELFTTIDAPYEVESMLVNYLDDSPRSEHFVREFLDRRHTCWQLHRKRMEEMQNDSKLKKSQSDQQSSSTSTNKEGTVYFVKAYSEANDSQADSMWQQIKPKSSSGRRGKKVGKH